MVYRRKLSQISTDQYPDGIPNWIAGYHEFMCDCESPDNYLTWAAIFTISGAAQRKIRLDWGSHVIYPNFYVVLVGPPGKTRKGSAVKPVKSLLRQAGTTLTPDSVTRAQLIRIIADSTKRFKIDECTYEDHCSVAVFSPELTVFLGKKDEQLLSDLTDLYDCADEWSYQNKADASNGITDMLSGVYLTSLACTTPFMLHNALSTNAIGLGLSSRMIFVCEKNRRFVHPLPFFQHTELGINIKQALQADLRHIAQLHGTFKANEAFADKYMTWYMSMPEEPPFDVHRFSGYWARRADHLRKVCMIISLSEREDFILNEKDFDIALNILTKTEEKMPWAFAGVGRDRTAELLPTIMAEIAAKKRTYESELLASFLRDTNQVELAQIINALAKVGYVNIIGTANGRLIEFNENFKGGPGWMPKRP